MTIFGAVSRLGGAALLNAALYQYTVMDNIYKDRTGLARDLFLEGYNCSQSVFAAFADIYGIDRDTALKIASSFGAGIGRLRETCGAACGMFLAAGLETGSAAPGDREGKAANYAAVQELAGEFTRRIGALRCADILKLRADAPKSHIPQERTAEYYRSRPCLRNVETAAEIYGEYLTSKRRSED